MKKCENCGKIYSNDMYFCSDCGVALKEAEPVTGKDSGSAFNTNTTTDVNSGAGGNEENNAKTVTNTSNVSDTFNNISSQVKSTVEGAQSSADTYFSEQSNYRNGAEKLYKQHGGLILGILGIIFGWWISGLVALIMALCGFYLCKFEKSQTLRWIALACCTIALLFGILAFLL